MPHQLGLNYWNPQYYLYKNVINQCFHDILKSMKSLIILGTSMIKKKGTKKGE